MRCPLFRCAMSPKFWLPLWVTHYWVLGMHAPYLSNRELVFPQSLFLHFCLSSQWAIFSFWMSIYICWPWAKNMLPSPSLKQTLTLWPSSSHWVVNWHIRWKFLETFLKDTGNASFVPFFCVVSLSLSRWLDVAWTNIWDHEMTLGMESSRVGLQGKRNFILCTLHKERPTKVAADCQLDSLPWKRNNVLSYLNC